MTVRLIQWESFAPLPQMPQGRSQFRVFCTRSSWRELQASLISRTAGPMTRWEMQHEDCKERTRDGEQRGCGSSRYEERRKFCPQSDRGKGLGTASERHRCGANYRPN